jgi:hypothetical protein
LNNEINHIAEGNLGKPIKFTSGNKDLYGYVEENGVKRNLTKEEFDNYEKERRDKFKNYMNKKRNKLKEEIRRFEENYNPYEILGLEQNDLNISNIRVSFRDTLTNQGQLFNVLSDGKVDINQHTNNLTLKTINLKFVKPENKETPKTIEHKPIEDNLVKLPTNPVKIKLVK